MSSLPKRRHLGITLMMIGAMFAFAGHVAAGDKTMKPTVPTRKPVKKIAVTADGNNLPQGDGPSSPHLVLAEPPANDTCAGAEALTLNQTTYGTTVDANDDYHSPKTAACFPGDGQFPTDSTGRDVVYSFSAPADGKYTFRQTARDVTSAIYGPGQNVSLYLTDCANAGMVTCLKGGNAMYGQTGVGSLGQNDQLFESVNCYPMTAGQTVYLIFDDGTPGRCSDNNHKCSDNSFCHPGATCDPRINAGGSISVEVIECQEEVEPNDTPDTANALSCGVAGATGVAPSAHCWLGDRNGNSCDRPYGNVSFLDQTNEDSNMRCLVSGAMCVIDTTAGTDDCAAGTGPCQQQTDFDCDPRCDVGPNAGKSCSTHAFCNPVSDQGATCAGACIIDAHCIDDATGVDTGVACTPTCQGSTIPSVNGRVCASSANFDACPGGGTCTVTAVIPAPGAACSTGQTCSRRFNEGDTDFFSVGSPASGSKVFAALFASEANDFDYRMRVTTATNTLQFDDNDTANFFGGSFSSVIGGAVTDGSPTYIEVSRTIPRTTNTYRVYSIVRPPIAAAENEDESGPFGNNITFYWPGDVIVANPTTTGYVKGNMNFPGDTDCFKFLTNKGDLMDFIGDGGPGRGTGSVATVSDPFPLLFDAEPAGIANFVFGTEAKQNTAANVQGPGLRALSPAVTSAYVQWRAAYTGMLEVCWYDLRNFYPTSGPQNYPTPWAASMSSSCGNVQPAGPGTTTAEVSITKTGPVGPVETGQIVQFTVTVTNEGSEIAQAVEIVDQLDANLTYVSLSVDDTLNGNNTACFSLPTAGTNDAPIDCVNASMAPGTSTVYTISVQVNNCIGGDVTITNQADIVASDSIDPNPDNNSASSAPFVTVPQANNGCADVLCDPDTNTCIEDLCTEGQVCDGGVCTGGGATVCNDDNLCTDDTCDSAVGCVFDSSEAGDLCDDFNACTENTCDPLLFCLFPPFPVATPCDDGLTCTSGDACDGAGVCSGDLGPCNDANPCTEDFADEGNACACTHTPATDGTACDDSNACTGTQASGDSCVDGSCNGGETVDCNDGNACTADSCNSLSGCVHEAIGCDDGNICDGVETCDPATGCVAGTPLSCSDGNACNGVESCDPATGCVAGTPLSCSDGNACNGVESCDPATGCVAGTPLSCNDGNACNGVESCDTATGCVGGVPVICTASDQCHDAGVCSPGSGLCSNPAKADGTTCDDGNAGTSGDSCQAGVCAGGSACTSSNDPKSKGWYKSLCHNPHSGDSLTNADAACVGALTSTFAGVSTVAQLCAVLEPSHPNNDKCSKAEDQLMTLALNICKQRVCPSNGIDSSCGNSESVAQSLAESDAIFDNPSRTTASCDHAECLDKEINNGQALEPDSLVSVREGANIRLNWQLPYVDDSRGAPMNYSIWRRAAGSKAAFVKIGTVSGLTYLDTTVGTGSWEYNLTPNF